jgi:hypothetical protein
MYELESLPEHMHIHVSEFCAVAITYSFSVHTIGFSFKYELDMIPVFLLAKEIRFFFFNNATILLLPTTFICLILNYSAQTI